MKRIPLYMLGAGAAIVLVAGGFYAGRHVAVIDPAKNDRTTVDRTTVDRTTADHAAPTPPTERKVLYWHDPMVPGPRFDKPGKSPFMDMQLVPVYADEASDAGVSVSPTLQQNLGIRTATVERRMVAPSFEAVGTVQFDERLTVAVQTRVAGYVEHLAVRAPMQRVRQGQALATVFAPDWLGPQNELLALERAGASADLVDAARERLHALSVPASLVRQSEASGTAQARYTLDAPTSGVVAELGVREGVAVAPGATLFRIAGLQKVWAIVDVPEAQALHLTRGQPVKATVQADARRSFTGVLDEILPQVGASTRTVQARFEVDNADGALMPGMLLRVQIDGPRAARLVVPAEAVIRTGTRVVAIVRNGDGRFTPRDVQLGADLGDALEVTAGLREGEQVVASGQFLIDAEARLKSVLGEMAPATSDAAPAMSAPPAMPGMPAMSDRPAPATNTRGPSDAGTYDADGTIEQIEAQRVTISHGPVAALHWPAMTMGFGKPTPDAFADLKPGDAVHFTFKADGAGGYAVVSMQRRGARP